MALSKWPVLGIDPKMHPLDSRFQQRPQIAPILKTVEPSAGRTCLVNVGQRCGPLKANPFFWGSSLCFLSVTMGTVSSFQY